MPSRNQRERNARKPAATGGNPGDRSNVPGFGALDEGDIRALDLRQRSNGENDWQDEMPTPRRRKASDASGSGRSRDR